MVQCPDCALYWEVGIVYCTRGKCTQPTERNRQLNKERFDVLSIPGYVLTKSPFHGARHGPSVRKTMYYKAHDVLRKARNNKNGNCDIILERWSRMTNTESLCQILGGLRNISFNVTQLRWKIIPTWLQGKKEVGTKNPEKFL